MDIRPAFTDFGNPNDMLNLKNLLSQMADELDVLYSTTAPNGNISARQGRICLYNNSGTYTLWKNTTGSTTWVQLLDSSELDTSSGHDHDGSDSKKVIATNLDLTGITNSHYLYSNAGTLAGKDIMNTSTGHDHDGSDSKKVEASNLEDGSISSGQYLKSDGTNIVGASPPGLQWKSTQTPSASTTTGDMTIENNKMYLLVFFLQIASDGTVAIEFNNDTTNNVYLHARDGYEATAALGDEDLAAEELKVADVDGGATNSFLWGQAFISTMDSGGSNRCQVNGTCSYIETFGDPSVNNFGGMWIGDTTPTSVELQSSQNLTGTVVLYELGTS